MQNYLKSAQQAFADEGPAAERHVPGKQWQSASSTTVGDRGAFTVNEFLDWARISRTTFYKEVSAGRLRLRKVGKRSLVLRQTAEEWLNSLPEAA